MSLLTAGLLQNNNTSRNTQKDKKLENLKVHIEESPEIADLYINK